MKAELQQLVALQNLDTSIRKLEKELEAIPERRAEIENEFDQRAFEIRVLENRRDEAKVNRARLENEVVEQKGRAERAERNLMSSKKQDEYTAAIREADAARRHPVGELDDQVDRGDRHHHHAGVQAGATGLLARCLTCSNRQIAAAAATFMDSA